MVAARGKHACYFIVQMLIDIGDRYSLYYLEFFNQLFAGILQNVKISFGEVQFRIPSKFIADVGF